MLRAEHQVGFRLGRMHYQLIREILASHFPQVADLHLVAAGFGERVGDAGILIELRAGEGAIVIDGDLLSVLIENPQDGIHRRAETLGPYFKDQLLVDAMVFSPEDIRHLVAKSGPTQVLYGTDVPIYQWPDAVDPICMNSVP